MTEEEFSKEITTNRLVLKKHELSLDYATKLLDLIQKNHDFLTKYLDTLRLVKAPQDVYAYLLKNAQNPKKADYGIWLKDELIGVVGVSRSDTDSSMAEINYWLSQEHTGNGYMAESVKALTEDLFKHGYDQLMIIMDTENKSSQNVAIRSGFTRNLILRNAHYNEVSKSSYDVFLYSKIRQKKEVEK